MAVLFDSPRLTLIRAKHHIDDFTDIINGFIAGKKWTRFIDKNSDPHSDLHKVRFNPFDPMLPCILFDAANNLRSTLDQIGYAAAVAMAHLVFFAFYKFAFCNYYYFLIGAFCCAAGALKPPPVRD